MNKSISKIYILIFIFNSSLFSQEIIVKLKPSSPRKKSDISQIQSLNEKFKPLSINKIFPQTKEKNPLDDVYILKFPKNKNLNLIISSYNNDSNVEYAEENHTYKIKFTPNDSRFFEQWSLKKIQAEKAWDIQKGSKNVIISVIDSGIDYLHEDSKNSLWENSGEIGTDSNGKDKRTNKIDDDGNGFVDDFRGWDFTDAPDFADSGDFLDRDNDPMDEHGHGTLVAGVIGAETNNSIGIAGLAFGCQVMNLRAGTSQGYLQEDDVASAIVYAVQNGAKVINMSFGDVFASQLLHDVIFYAHSKNVVLVASAGNSSSDESHYPSAYDETISVGATFQSDVLASFSNFGSTVDIVAPGVDILSTNLNETHNGYDLVSGTSFSGPLVSATCGLLLSKNSDLTNEEVKGILLTSTDDLGDPGWDNLYASGRLNTYRALRVPEGIIARILFPSTDEGIKGNSIAIIGTSSGISLKSYSLYYGKGTNPPQWNEIQTQIFRQIIQDTLALWDISNLNDGEYVIRLVVQQVTGISIEDRARIFIDKTPSQIKNIKTVQMLNKDIWSANIEFETDDLTTAKIFYRNYGVTGQFQKIDLNYVTRTQKINISQNELIGKFEFYIEVKNRSGLISKNDNGGQFFILDLSQSPFITNNFVQKDYTLPSSFLLKKTFDFDGDGNREILTSRYTKKFNFGPFVIYEFDNLKGKFVAQKDSTKISAIPRDIEDIDNDGKYEVLLGEGSRTRLIEAKNVNEFPTETIFRDTSDFWGSRIYDLYNDGKKELIARRGFEWIVWKLSQNLQLQFVDSLKNPTKGTNGVGVPHSEIADFDDDGKNEILLGDYDGEIFIYETETSGKFVNTFKRKLPLTDAIDFLTTGDFDGDGKTEFVAGCHSDPILDSEYEFDARYWTFVMFKSNGNNSFHAIDSISVFGFYPPRDFNSGISSGDVDNDGDDELLLCVFPNFYMINYNKITKKLEPTWYYPNCRSNLSVVDDFDKNNLKEFYFNDGKNVISFEKSSTPVISPPLNFSAVPLDTERIELNWSIVTNAEKYKIYRGTTIENLALIDSSTNLSYLDKSVTKNIIYFYSVTAFNSTTNPKESKGSDIKSAKPNPNPIVLKAEYINEKQISVLFNEEMDESIENTNSFFVNKGIGEPISSAFSKSGREAILTFENEFTEEGIYTVTVSSVRDIEKTLINTLKNTASFEVKFPVETPYIVSAKVLQKALIEIQFNNEMNDTTAQDISNYSFIVSGGKSEIHINILSAKINESKKKIKLKIEDKVPIGALGRIYTLRVKDVKNLKGIKIKKGKGDSFSLSFAKDNLNEVYVYPNPYLSNSGTDRITFANLTPTAKINIYDSSGRFLKMIEEKDGNGGADWFLDDRNGNKVSSGIYIYIIKSGKEMKKGKFAVVR